MRLVPGATIAVALMTVLLTACGGGTAATYTAVPAPTTAAGGGASTDASACPTPVPAGQVAPPPGARASGTITALAGTTLTVTQPDKTTVTVMTTPNTIYNKESVSSVSAIGVGDLLMIAPTTSSESVPATMIFDNGTQMMQRQRSALAAGCPFVPSGGNFAIGTVTKVSVPTLTLTVAGGKAMTVTTDGTTKVTLREMSAFADLKTGDQVIMASAAASGTASATTVSGSASATSGFVAFVVNYSHAAQ